MSSAAGESLWKTIADQVRFWLPGCDDEVVVVLYPLSDCIGYGKGGRVKRGATNLFSPFGRDR